MKVSLNSVASDLESPDANKARSLDARLIGVAINEHYQLLRVMEQVAKLQTDVVALATGNDQPKHAESNLPRTREEMLRHLHEWAEKSFPGWVAKIEDDQ